MYCPATANELNTTSAVNEAFHAICLRMLRSAADCLPRYHLSPSFVICDTDEQLRLVREAMKLVSADGLPDQEQTPVAVHGRILRAKA